MHEIKVRNGSADDRPIVGLTLCFVGGGSTPQCVIAAHRCVRRALLDPPLTLTVFWSGVGEEIASLSMRLPDGAHIHAAGPSVLSAMLVLCGHAAAVQRASPEDRRRLRAVQRPERVLVAGPA